MANHHQKQKSQQRGGREMSASLVGAPLAIGPAFGRSIPISSIQFMDAHGLPGGIQK
jgi:hypothetical protein